MEAIISWQKAQTAKVNEYKHKANIIKLFLSAYDCLICICEP